ncbi:MAG: hypothetical protein LBU64_05360 [Planctomycetota bacterium]|jgi:hypothetical protein|nr:hypothetical protein [Planctomycetota bacterium]
MRKGVPAAIALFCLLQFKTPGGETSGSFFPDLLPANTIACLTPPDRASLEQAYSGSLFSHLLKLPEMGAFLRDLEESRRLLANDLAQSAGVSPQFAAELLEAKLGFALINAGIGRDGGLAMEYAVVLALRAPPDRATVFAAVMALLNRREIIGAILKNRGLDPNLPLKTLAQEEIVSGYPPILRVGPDLRVAALGNLILVHGGRGSEGITRLFDAASRPDSSLARNPLFQAAWRGSEAGPGTSFVYVNHPRLMAILDALNLGGVTGFLDALGFSRVQAIGISGAYHREGVRHNLYLHSPGGGADGLLSGLLPIPREWRGVGMEVYGQSIPDRADSFAALRMDPQVFLSEASRLVKSLASPPPPGGMAKLALSESILGVPLSSLAKSLGNEVILLPQDDTQIVMFGKVNIPAFEAAVSQMEQNAGTGFRTLNADGYPVRYFNRGSSLQVPLAPAFCLAPSAPGGQTGVLYAASHPQALASFIRDTRTSAKSLAASQDFQKVLTGLSENYSFYYYNRNLDGYRRVYNFILPLSSLWAGASHYPVDTGLLPIASAVVRDLFGCGIGIKNVRDGIAIQVFSPVGANFIPILLLDRLVISNPLVLGYLYSWLENPPATPPIR